MKNYNENSLSKQWSNYQNEFGDNPIFKREYVFAIPRKSDILNTGINPSDNKQLKHSFSFYEADYRYFTKLFVLLRLSKITSTFWTKYTITRMNLQVDQIKNIKTN